MRCDVCGGDRFTKSEYQMEGGAAPAFECTHCHALNLNEEAARSDAERDSVRLAVAARARAGRSD